jgi:hypothetical protein
MMKFFKLSLICIGLLAFQVLLEASFYQSFLFIKDGKAGNIFLDHVFRYSMYRFSLSILPYLFLMLICIKLLKVPPTDFAIAIMNLTINVLIVSFFWFLEGSAIFDKKIVIVTLIVGLILWVILLKTKFVSRVVES